MSNIDQRLAALKERMKQRGDSGPVAGEPLARVYGVPAEEQGRVVQMVPVDEGTPSGPEVISGSRPEVKRQEPAALPPKADRKPTGFDIFQSKSDGVGEVGGDKGSGSPMGGEEDDGFRPENDVDDDGFHPEEEEGLEGAEGSEDLLSVMLGKPLGNLIEEQELAARPKPQGKPGLLSHIDPKMKKLLFMAGAGAFAFGVWFQFGTSVSKGKVADSGTAPVAAPKTSEVPAALAPILAAQTSHPVQKPLTSATTVRAKAAKPAPPPLSFPQAEPAVPPGPVSSKAAAPAAPVTPVAKPVEKTASKAALPPLPAPPVPVKRQEPAKQAPKKQKAVRPAAQSAKAEPKLPANPLRSPAARIKKKVESKAGMNPPVVPSSAKAAKGMKEIAIVPVEEALEEF